MGKTQQQVVVIIFTVYWWIRGLCGQGRSAHLFPCLYSNKQYVYKMLWVNRCEGVVQQYNDYTVKISGCGLGPDNTYCTQVATFIRAAGLDSITIPYTNSEHTGNTGLGSATKPRTSSEHAGKAQMSVASQCEVSDHSPLRITNDPPLESTRVSSNYPSTPLLIISDMVSKDFSLGDYKMDTTYRLVAKYDYPYDRRTQEEKDEDQVYDRFFCLRRRLQESLWEMEGNAEHTGSSVLPPPLASLSPSQDTEEGTTKFSIVYLPSEDLINDERDIAKDNVKDFDCAVTHIANNGRSVGNNSDIDNENSAGSNNSASNKSTAKDKYIFYIVDLKYAILPLKSLLAWMNYNASQILSSDIIR